MFWNFVATVFAGLGAAGIAMGIRAVTAKKAPRWLVPVFGGAGMLAYMAYMEYTWFDLKQSQLPEDAVVVSEEQESVIWRPWSLVVPQTSRFTVVDTSSIVADEQNPKVFSFYLYRFEKSYTDSVEEQVYLLNCVEQQLVPVSENGEAMVQSLQKLADDDRLLGAVCT
ncbi:hypothetical protein [Marinobacter fonticola]|uniref:hypothetical protein n=1 Tax=Marinobacter fonticola TaxID=2603215 RepID=UPI0011E6A8D4|nr:hypothetical protein [Marinobacter fonticola]